MAWISIMVNTFTTPCQKNVNILVPFRENDEPQKYDHEGKTLIFLQRLNTHLNSKLVLVVFKSIILNVPLI